VLYLTVFLGSKRRVTQWILFAVAAVGCLIGVVITLESWRSWNGNQSFLPFSMQVWGWVDFAVLPLLLALINLRKSLAPVAVAIGFSVALPWCRRIWVETLDWNNGDGHQLHIPRNEPNLLAHA
jgi:cobalamin synthase